MAPPPFISSIAIRNFRGIAECDTELGSLHFLVGPNRAGKSSFLDALAFLRDATRDSLDHAIRNRGGIIHVRRRSSGRPTHFGIKVCFTLPSGSSGRYGFRIGAKSGGGYVVQSEVCEVFPVEGPPAGPPSHFTVRNGRARGSPSVLPPASTDRLFLVAAAGLPEFEEVYQGFTQMGFYGLNPAAISLPQPPHSGDLLTPDGANVAAVLAKIAAQAPSAKERIGEYLQAVVPGVTGADRVGVGSLESLEFRQRVRGDSAPWRFPAHTMSDGTLRSLAILVALFQPGSSGWTRLPLIGIEEPELALHPGATAVLLDALREASAESQVIVTSHSPDLLDHQDISADELLAVVSLDGNTIVGQPSVAARDALMAQLYTAGELLRMDQLHPEAASAD